MHGIAIITKFLSIAKFKKFTFQSFNIDYYNYASMLSNLVVIYLKRWLQICTKKAKVNHYFFDQNMSISGRRPPTKF